METAEKTPEQELKEARDELAFAQRRLAAAEEQIRASKHAALDAMKPEFRRLAAEFGKARAVLYKFWCEVRRKCVHRNLIVAADGSVTCPQCTLGYPMFEWPAAALGDESNVAVEDEAVGMKHLSKESV